MFSNTVVSIVDDDKDVRQSLETLLNGKQYSTSCYASAEDFLESFDPATAGCLLLDVRMPGMDGLELQGVMQNRNWKIPVIIMTGHANVRMAVEALSAGASAIIEKPFRRAELIESIERAIVQNQKSRKSQARWQELEERFQALTPREIEIVDLVVAGLLTKQIALELNIGDRTVETHRRNLMRKLSANSVAELVTLRLEHRSFE
ncbi:MAG: response regulator transcription factor [Planctomycetes bacterium]|nr:response regulator transcription factor [Planctomycetota bacterium]